MIDKRRNTPFPVADPSVAGRLTVNGRIWISEFLKSRRSRARAECCAAPSAWQRYFDFENGDTSPIQDPGLG